MGWGVLLGAALGLVIAAWARADVVLITDQATGGVSVYENGVLIQTEFANASESRTSVCLPSLDARQLQVMYLTSSAELVVAWAIESPCGYDFGDGRGLIATNYPGHEAAVVTVAGNVWTLTLAPPVRIDGDPGDIDPAPAPPGELFIGACCWPDGWCVVLPWYFCFWDWRWGGVCEPDICER